MDPVAAAGVLSDAVSALESAEITCWLTDGTLLGCVRDKGFIPHDDDVDLGIWAGYDELELLTVMLRASFTLTAVHGEPERGRELRFSRDGIALDFFVFYLEGDTCWHAAWLGRDMIRFRYPRLELSSVDFMGRSFLAPTPPEDFLERKYGDWRTPRRDWHWAYSPMNAEFDSTGWEFHVRRLARLADHRYRRRRWFRGR